MSKVGISGSSLLGITSDGIVEGSTNLYAIAPRLIPPGAMIPYAGVAAPTGWLLAYGQAISRTTYADLFAVIGEIYGVGDGSTTFNLPDTRGRILAGLDNLGGASANRVVDAQADALGGVAGAETHTLIESEMPAHYHSYNLPAAIASGSTPNAINAGTPTATNTSTVGGGGAHNNMQPSLFVSLIIKT